MELFLKYYVILNGITFMVFTLDKWKAKRNRWRIPEKVLLGLSFVGGAVGGLIAMYTCRHKTQKKRFSIGLPMMVVLHIVIALYINKNFI